MSRYQQINQKLADLFQSGRDVLESPSLEKNKSLQFISLWFLLDDCILTQKG